jgi:hypothetical protein
MILDPNPKDAWAPLGERPLCSKSPPTDLGPMARNRLLGSLCRHQLPTFAMLLNVNNNFAHFYGGTSLLIMVGVVLDTLQQIESHLLMRHYDGLMKTGKVKGRIGGASGM